MRMTYFEQEDILHLMAAPGPEVQSVELSPDVAVELYDEGQVLGLEIVSASQHAPDLLAQLVGEMQTAGTAELEYQLQEGLAGAVGDDELLPEALETLQTYRRDRSG
jgi:uncharacterized protein YuzE